MFLEEMADAGRIPEVTAHPKKRRKLGRKWERARDERLRRSEQELDSYSVLAPCCSARRAIPPHQGLIPSTRTQLYGVRPRHGSCESEGSG